MSNDDELERLLEIPTFLRITPERQKEIEAAARAAEKAEARAKEERREEAARAYKAALDAKSLKIERAAARKKEREAREGRRRAKHEVYQRVLGIAGIPFTIGRLEKKLGVERPLLMSAIRRGL